MEAGNSHELAAAATKLAVAGDSTLAPLPVQSVAVSVCNSSKCLQAVRADQATSCAVEVGKEAGCENQSKLRATNPSYLDGGGCGGCGRLYGALKRQPSDSGGLPCAAQLTQAAATAWRLAHVSALPEGARMSAAAVAMLLLACFDAAFVAAECAAGAEARQLAESLSCPLFFAAAANWMRRFYSILGLV